jgi:DnaJ like chaperone protein
MLLIRDTELDSDRQSDPRLSTVEQHQLTFFVAAFSMLAKLAQADGRVKKEEIDSIERLHAKGSAG